MKTSKLFITSLLAAAAMSTSAYADTVTYTGGDDVTNKTLGGYTLTDTITMGTTIAQDSPAANLGSMTAPGNFYPPAYTLSFWVDISALPSSDNITLFTYGGEGSNNAGVFNALVLKSDGSLSFGQGNPHTTDSSKFVFSSDANRQVTTTDNALTTNTAYHIALVNNGKGGAANTATLYINGTAVLNNVTVNLNMAGGNTGTVFSNLNLASASNISYGEATLLSNVALSQQGVQKVATHNSYNLIWNGSASNAWNSTDANWTKEGTEGNVAFEDTDNVTFNSNASVTIQNAGVTAGSVAVTAGAVSLSGGTLTAIRGVSVTGGTLSMNLGIGGGTDVSVTNDGVLSGTITSMAAGSSLTLNGTNASTVTVTGTIGTATLNIQNGSLTWTHDGVERSSAASITIGAGSTFKDQADYKYSLTLSGALSGAGTLISKAPTTDNGNVGQGDGFRTVTLSGSTENFIGEWQLETAYSKNTSGNKRIDGVLNSSDGKFGGVVNFTVLPETESDVVSEAKTSSRLSLAKNMEIGGLKGTLSNTIVGSNNADSRALTINTVADANYDYAGTIASTISGITKTGLGTQVLSGDNSAYAGTTRIEGGKLVAASANALGTGTVTVSADATLGVKVASAVTAGTVTFNEGSKFLIDLTGVSVAENTALTIITSSAISFGSLETGSLTSNIIESYFDADSSVLGDYSTWLREWSYNGSTLSLTMTIPEPSTFGLLAGLGALALAGTRRRRRKA